MPQITTNVSQDIKTKLEKLAKDNHLSLYAYTKKILEEKADE